MSTVDLSSARWRKSSRSGTGNNGNCVEVAFSGRAAAIRDSKNPAGPTLVLPGGRFQTLLAGLR